MTIQAKLGFVTGMKVDPYSNVKMLLNFCDHQKWLVGDTWGHFWLLLMVYFSSLAFTFHYERGDICFVGNG